MLNRLQRITPSRSRLRRAGAVLNGRSRRGQSLVEITLTLPILFILLFGMVEIGWYASSYLILLDASREGGRLGANGNPVEGWQFGMTDNLFRHNCCSGRNASAACPKNTRPEVAGMPGPPYDNEVPFGYFEEVACQVLFNMPPLEFDWTRDEIVVSIFSYTEFEQGRTPFERIDPRFPLAGRWPLERNQCTPDPDDPTSTEGHLGYTLTAAGNCNPSDPLCIACDPSTGVGCANHRRDDGCYGSEWDPSEIEARLTKDSPPGALVLVEVFWWHDQLLGLPFVSTLANPSEIYVWVMFPVSAAEPTVEP